VRHPVLILFHCGSDLLILSRDSIFKLRSVITHTILTTELYSLILLDNAALLLKMNENVDSAVELSRDGIAVMIAGVLTVRITL